MIDTLVVHCSDSPQGRGDDAAEIHRWHLKKKWDGIGYHAVVLEDGTIQHGRPIYWQGAHVKGHNRNSLAVCLIGHGYDATGAQFASLRSLLQGWKRKWPDARVCGHRDLQLGKDCPGFDVAQWWGDA